MKTLFFSTHEYEREFLQFYCEKFGIIPTFIKSRLNLETIDLVKDSRIISCWANDCLSQTILERLKDQGVKFIVLRSAGFSHLDVGVARKLGFSVARVPSYSPEAIAEHTLGLLLSINRKIPRAYQRVKDFNFSIDGLNGITLHGKTVGIIGVGKIGKAFAKIMNGMGCKLLFYDPITNYSFARDLNAKYVDLKYLLENSDVVSLHCPLNEHTKSILNHKNIDFLKKGAFLLNTGRGALIQTDALIEKLKKNELSGVGLDVYEHEENIFSHDLSLEGISDDKLLRLMSFPNVLITSHQAFFTKEALDNISKVTCENIFNFQNNVPIDNGNMVF